MLKTSNFNSLQTFKPRTSYIKFNASTWDITNWGTWHPEVKVKPHIAKNLSTKLLDTKLCLNYKLHIENYFKSNIDQIFCTTRYSNQENYIHQIQCTNTGHNKLTHMAQYKDSGSNFLFSIHFQITSPIIIIKSDFVVRNNPTIDNV